MSKELAINHNEKRFHLDGLNLELDNFINIDKAGIKQAAITNNYYFFDDDSSIDEPINNGYYE